MARVRGILSAAALGLSAAAAAIALSLAGGCAEKEKGGFGATCVRHDECASGLCFNLSDPGYCTMACRNVESCPEGYACKMTKAGDVNIAGKATCQPK